MTVVFKLGGSLLNLPGLADKLRAVLAQRPRDECVIVPGGGPAADVVREWSCVHNLGEETAHWLAVSSLELNRQFLQKIMGLNCVSSRAGAKDVWAKDLSPVLLDMTGFLTAEEANVCVPLPHNWAVTSDSLAAWTAIRWPADELILLKSIPVPRGLTADEASRAGFVDAYFPNVARQQRCIHWCNLRASELNIKPWLVDSAESDFVLYADH